MYKAIDLFSGAGGLSTGLKLSGWDVIASVEKDPSCHQTYRHNHPDTKLIDDDITNVSFNKFKGIDLIAGGPACQPFSVAGKQLAESDSRNMIPQFIRAVAEASPNAFIMENVSGLHSPRHAAYFESVLLSLRNLGYKLFKQVVDAADYGVPQHRKRLLIVGFRKNVIFKFPTPTHGPQVNKPFLAVFEALANVPEDEPNAAIVTYAKNPVLRPSPFAGMLVNGAGRPIDPSRPGPTIPASAGGNRTHIVDTQGVLLKYHRYLMAGGQPKSGVVEGVRRLTLRESARLQSFDDGYEFFGTKSKMYSQVGNAVPPILAKVIGEAVMTAFKNF